MEVNAVHWFWKGLRLHDNPAPRECIQGADTIRRVCILDPWFAGSSNVGINRWSRSQILSARVPLQEMELTSPACPKELTDNR
ncbi:hypothetical protein XELAEV_18044351mg [Xenopus laevis]|uniref:Photolyase/cryptochrome alpha/beta domain-containing protein n=1 Tax=Xenopus laevis TaxID=8355 RepID=A0A974BYC6_XENLA|nr:hypothetical protein XELAEV_18044351mg [Xenopus laevis]